MSNNTRIALITGASKRLGLNTVKNLHNDGFSILLHHRSVNTELTDTINHLNNIRANSVYSICCELDEAAPKKLVNELDVKFGRLDLLVNNASSFYPKKIIESTFDDWDALLQSNLKTPYFLSKACAPLLEKASGSIINMIDIYHERPLKDHSIYSIAKAGLAGLTKNFALEFAPNIRVNGISPGAILWPEGESEEHIDRITNMIPLGRIGDPDDIARTILFLTKSPYITGQIISVDGGRSLNI